MTAVTIYHNPDCGTSRNTMALIRHSGIEPTTCPAFLAMSCHAHVQRSELRGWRHKRYRRPLWLPSNLMQRSSEVRQDRD